MRANRRIPFGFIPRIFGACAAGSYVLVDRLSGCLPIFDYHPISKTAAKKEEMRETSSLAIITSSVCGIGAEEKLLVATGIARLALLVPAAPVPPQSNLPSHLH